VKSIKTISIILKPKSVTEFVSILPNLVTYLEKRKVRVCYRLADKERIENILKNRNYTSIFLKDDVEIHKKSDLIISLGGDGTLLGISRNSKTSSPPILGVNMGNLGFITEFSKSELYDGLDLIFSNKYEVSKIPLYEVSIPNRKLKYQFMNDVVISKSEISRMITLTASTSSEHIFNLSGDGLIVSSPIGSTAYSLAAGGPILHPSVKSMLLTPICPHSLTNRPLVISDTTELEVAAAQNSESLLITMDGQEAIKLLGKEKVYIKRSKFSAKMVLNPNRTYYHTLKIKFTHGRR